MKEIKDRNLINEKNIAFENQARINFNTLSKEEEDARKKEAIKRESKKKYTDGNNFIVLDTETNGFTHHEPIQITAIRYENGKALKNHYNHFFMPDNKFTKSAKKSMAITR